MHMHVICCWLAAARVKVIVVLQLAHKKLSHIYMQPSRDTGVDGMVNSLICATHIESTGEDNFSLLVHWGVPFLHPKQVHSD
jgi:hypothetical protein